MTGRFTPRPAVRRGQKARVAFAGPSGSGKTWTSLETAVVLADGAPVLVIDTERGSASLYADFYEFTVIEWTPPFDPRELADVVAEHAAGYAVIVVDSLSHFWEAEGGTRDIVDAAAARARGNSFAGWKEGTPAQNDMVAALLQAPCHIVATMRSKTEYILETNANGKQVPRKVGMAPIQRAGIEYEFTVTADIDHEHSLIVDKTRCHPLAGKMYKLGHTVELAEVLRDWLGTAEPAEPPPPAVSPDNIARIVAACDEKGVPVAEVVLRATDGRTDNPADLYATEVAVTRQALADVIGGLAVMEEVVAVETAEEPANGTAAPATATRKAPARKTAARKAAAPPAAPAALPPVPEPPLPGEDGYDDEPGDPAPDDDVASKRRQQVAMRCKDLDLDRGDLIYAVSAGRHTSARALDADDLSAVLEVLRQIKVGAVTLDTSGDEPVLRDVDPGATPEGDDSAEGPAPVEGDEVTWDEGRWRGFLTSRRVKIVPAVKAARDLAEQAGLDPPAGLHQLEGNAQLAGLMRRWIEEQQ